MTDSNPVTIAIIPFVFVGVLALIVEGIRIWQRMPPKPAPVQLPEDPALHCEILHQHEWHVVNRRVKVAVCLRCQHYGWDQHAEDHHLKFRLRKSVPIKPK